MDSLLKVAGDQVTQGMERQRYLMSYLSHSLLARLSISNSRFPDTKEKVQCKEGVPLVEGNQARESLRKLDKHKSMGRDGMHPQVLREIANVIMRPLLINFD